MRRCSVRGIVRSDSASFPSALHDGKQPQDVRLHPQQFPPTPRKAIPRCDFGATSTPSASNRGDFESIFRLGGNCCSTPAPRAAATRECYHRGPRVCHRRRDAGRGQSAADARLHSSRTVLHGFESSHRRSMRKTPWRPGETTLTADPLLPIVSRRGPLWRRNGRRPPTLHPPAPGFQWTLSTRGPSKRRSTA